MWQLRSGFIVACVIAIASFAGGASAQTASTEVKQFEIVSVDGNNVVVKGVDGAAQEIRVPDDFRLTVDGQPVSVRDLKPGMKGTARITTTTTVTPVTVTEVKKGKVLKVAGNSIMVRTEDGTTRMFSESEAAKRGVKIVNSDGKPIRFTDLREGYELTATIVTQKPPQVLTQREVEAALKSVPAAAPAPAPPARAASAPAPTPSAAATASPAPARQLPKTASPWPLIALVGTAALAVAGLLMARRRRVQVAR